MNLYMPCLLGLQGTCLGALQRLVAWYRLG